ncbi:hypothetical protein FRB95_005857 [Tulasnella sp. JGI-2019a]|nr:hypothetical protein FRB95_005857 [Tulasnella sp. JGI-2019a]
MAAVAPAVASVAASVSVVRVSSSVAVVSSAVVAATAAAAASSSHAASIAAVATAAVVQSVATTSSSASKSSAKKTTTSTSAVSTGTTAASTTSGSSHSINTGAIIAICVIVSICAIGALFAVRRCIRRRQTNKRSELPPPNTSFFQPYWRTSQISSNQNVNRGGEGFFMDDKSSSRQEARYSMPLAYGGRSGSGTPSRSSRANSWRKSLGEGTEIGTGEHHPNSNSMDSRSGTMTMVSNPSPLGAGAPLMPPAARSDPFLTASPSASQSSLTTPPDLASNTNNSPIDLTSSPTNLTPTDAPSRTGSPHLDSLPPRTDSPRSRTNGSQARRTRPPPEEHTRRQSQLSLASGYSERRNSVIRGPPHKSNMQIILPQPLAPNLANNLNVDPIGTSGPPSAYGNRHVSNRMSRVDLWADSLAHSHSLPNSIDHGEEQAPSRKGSRKERKSVESADLNGGALDRSRSKNNRLSRQEPLPTSRSGTPGTQS